MKRFLLFGLGIAVLGFSGCGSVRGFRIASVNSSCQDVCVIAPETIEPHSYQPSRIDPDVIAPAPVAPTRAPQKPEDDLPPPPPAELDNVTQLRRPIRKPILIPIQQTAFKLKGKVAATLH